MSIKGFGRMPSHMKSGHDFSMIPQANIQRSVFRRDHSHKTCFDSDYLIPIYVDEALPGDTFNMNLTSVAKLATPLVPYIDNLKIDYFFFAVPLRLVWNNFQKFMGEQIDPGDSIDYTVPTVDMNASTGATEGSIWDYMGIPIGVTSLTINALHSRAYNLIWNEWFRDENLQDSRIVDKDDGPDSEADYVLLTRGKRHDYFTSCLPWAQKGDSIDTPLTGYADVKYGPNIAGGTNYNNLYTVIEEHDNASYLTGFGYSATKGIWTNYLVNNSRANLKADLGTATTFTINTLRTAFQLQVMLEKDARGGTRYTELINSHFGVVSPDQRLQRPEYLGGGRSYVNVTPIPQTSEAGTTEQGNLAAVGYAQSTGVGFTKSFVEHCVILGLACATGDQTYQQGLHRMWSRQTREEFYFPALAHLGEQAVLNKEIYCDGSANDDAAFGYQERWSEYRYAPSRISGILRSQAASSIDYWHLAQEFGALPVLNSSFIASNTPVSRVVAVPSEPELIADFFFNLITTRPMPVYSVPGLIDHF